MASSDGPSMPIPFNTTGMTHDEILKKLSELLNSTDWKVIEPNSTLTPRVLTDGGFNEPDEFARARNLLTIYLWCTLFASIAGVLGNCLVLAVGLLKRSWLTNCKLLILHLAACDVLFAIMQLLLISSKFAGETWQLGGTPGCKLIRGATLMGSNVAIGTVLFIAIERYRGIVLPLKRRIPRKGMLLALGAVWVVSLAATVPALLQLEISDQGYCEQSWDSVTSDGPKVYALAMLIVFFCAPMLAIAFLYGCMINVLRRPIQEKLPGAGNMNTKQLQARRRDDIRIVTILAAVVVMFAVCVLPVRLFWVVYEFEHQHFTTTQYVNWNFFGLFPYPFHVAVNPVIYSVVDRNFRKGFVELIGKICKRKSRTKSLSSGLTDVQQIALIEQHAMSVEK